ncbi:MAG TPA: helix-turn-helix domain-containing protein [Trebonia sp.]|nr:helix-turn-helix domain-containing protein [Trebonia sp.]
MTGNAPSLTSTRLLTVFEVAAIMRLSKATVYRLVHAGDLEAIRVGRAFRIPEHAVRPQAFSPAREA